MDEMIANAEEFYQSLGIPYRIVNIVSGKGGREGGREMVKQWFCVHLCQWIVCGGGD